MMVMVDERKFFETIARLEEECKTNTTNIYEIYEKLQKANTTEEKTKCIQALQHINNKLFETHGLRDSILDFQVCINTLRSEYDVMDPDEVINKDDTGVYVQ
jgi:uncharacterized protein (UPF0335 family)